MTIRMRATAWAASLALAGLPLPAKAPSPGLQAVEDLLDGGAGRFRPAMMVPYDDLQCLAENVYWEARGESEEGQEAVAHVTLNRVGEAGFPDTICDVVRQGGREPGACQFEWYCDAYSDRPRDRAAWDKAVAVAVRALAGGLDPTQGALHFHNVALDPSWARLSKRRLVIGNHVFFRLTPFPQTAATAMVRAE